MMCHGNGDLREDPFMSGCCFVDGEVCRNRLYVEGSVVLDSDRRPVDVEIHPLAAGRRIVCKAVLSVLESNVALLDRDDLEAAWAASAEYAPIADHWEATGRSRRLCMEHGPFGWRPGIYFPGVSGIGDCCFREDPVTNAVRSSDLPDESICLVEMG